VFPAPLKLPPYCAIENQLIFNFNLISSQRHIHDTCTLARQCPTNLAFFSQMPVYSRLHCSRCHKMLSVIKHLFIYSS